MPLNIEGFIFGNQRLPFVIKHIVKAVITIAAIHPTVQPVLKNNIELHRFVVLPKRWIVERTLAWISRNRRLARDFERCARTAAAFVRLAMIRIISDA